MGNTDIADIQPPIIFLSSGLFPADGAGYREITGSHQSRDETIILPPLYLDSNLCPICVAVTSNLSACHSYRPYKRTKAHNGPTVHLFDTENTPNLDTSRLPVSY